MFPVTKKFLIYLNYVCALILRLKIFRKIKCTKYFFKGNIKFIGKLMKKKLKVLMKNFFQQTNFVLLLAHTKKKKFLFKNPFNSKKKYKNVIAIIAPRHIERSQKIKTLGKMDLNVQILNPNGIILKTIK